MSGAHEILVLQAELETSLDLLRTPTGELLEGASVEAKLFDDPETLVWVAQGAGSDENGQRAPIVSMTELS